METIKKREASHLKKDKTLLKATPLRPRLQNLSVIKTSVSLFFITPTATLTKLEYK